MMYRLTIEVSWSELDSLGEAATALLALIPELDRMIDLSGLEGMSINIPGSRGTGTITLSMNKKEVA